MIESLEQFDKAMEQKRAKLARNISNAKLLPTAGQRITWIGENGWDNEGKPRDPVSKSIEIVPWIMHDSTAYNAAEHVAYNFGDGEHVSSKYRADYCRKYLTALLDACEPVMLETVATRGTYASYFPSTFDYAANRNYKDAIETARGLYEVDITVGVGHNGFSSAALSFYVSQPVPYKVSIDLSRESFPHKLAPRPRYTTGRSEAFGRDVAPATWDMPDKAGASEVFKRRGPDGYSYTIQYLFATRALLIAALNFQTG